jgi:hypothetical protein
MIKEQAGPAVEHTPGRWVPYLLYGMAVFTSLLGTAVNATVFGQSSVVVGLGVALAAVWCQAGLVPEIVNGAVEAPPARRQPVTGLRRAS